jgi:acyl-ACP thioesterase
MKIEQTEMVEYEDVGTDFRMKLPALFQRLQRVALNHSDAVGLDTQTMIAAGAVWILNRIRVRIRRMPEYRESVTVTTWHKGSAGFRAGRDFLVLCGRETVAAAASQWLYYDIGRKRVAKIPERISAPYTDEPDEALESGAIDFAVDKTFETEETLSLTIREGDYDPNGHVNNTVYLDYLDTLIKRSGMADGGIGEVGIQYIKEIGRNVWAVQGGLIKENDSIRFRFFDQETVYAAGFVRTTDAL